jgi:hypothetical protein
MSIYAGICKYQLINKNIVNLSQSEGGEEFYNFNLSCNFVSKFATWGQIENTQFGKKFSKKKLKFYNTSYGVAVKMFVIQKIGYTWHFPFFIGCLSFAINKVCLIVHSIIKICI